jgi:hypothetical protein
VRKIVKRRKFDLPVAITYTPTGGDPNTETFAIKIRLWFAGAARRIRYTRVDFGTTAPVAWPQMESSAWTNERLDDLAESMRAGFARVDQDVRDLRTGMRDDLMQVRGEMRDGFNELRGGINDLRLEFRTVMFSVGGGIIIALIGVIGAILATSGWAAVGRFRGTA